MPLPLEERNEILVCNDKKDLMIELRKKIYEKFRKLWVLVHYDGSENRWGIEVSNCWGGVLDKDKRFEVEYFIEEFMLDYHSSLEEEEDEDEPKEIGDLIKVDTVGLDELDKQQEHD